MLALISTSVIRRPLLSLMQQRVCIPRSCRRSSFVDVYSGNCDTYTTSAYVKQEEEPILSSFYAVVDHSAAYEASLAGPHGKQLQLAALEGVGKDDPPFDPFIEEELELAQMLGEKVEASTDIDEEDDADDSDVRESKYDWRKVYNSDGSLKRTKAEKATLAAGAPSGGLFAIIELAGSQHKVTNDDLLIVNRLKPVSKYKIGSVHTLKGSTKDVLLIGSSHYTLVGMPYVTNSEVDFMVEEITQDAKIVIFTKRRRKNSKRKNGFRRDVTMLRILDVRPPPEQSHLYYLERPEPAPLVERAA